MTSEINVPRSAYRCFSMAETTDSGNDQPLFVGVGLPSKPKMRIKYHRKFRSVHIRGFKPSYSCVCVTIFKNDDDGGGVGGYVDDDEFGVRFPGGTRNSQRYDVLHRLNCNVAAEPLKTLISDLTTRGFYLDTKQYDSLSQVELTMTS